MTLSCGTAAKGECFAIIRLCYVHCSRDVTAQMLIDVPTPTQAVLQVSQTISSTDVPKPFIAIVVLFAASVSVVVTASQKRPSALKYAFEGAGK